MIQADPAGRFVLHVDLGLDKIFVWKFDAKKGTLTANDPPAVSLPPGRRAAALPLPPQRPWLYSIQEEGSTVVLFDYDADDRQADRPADDLHAAARVRRAATSARRSWCRPTAGSSTPATGCTTASAIFAVGADGTLTYVGEEWTRGNYPRSFTFDPTGQFLYCCNQRGGQRHRLPRGPQDRRPRASPASTPRSATRRASCSSTPRRRQSESGYDPQHQSQRTGGPSVQRLLHTHRRLCFHARSRWTEGPP